MSLSWFTLSNPVAVWWLFLLAVSAANIVIWVRLHRQFRRRMPTLRGGIIRIELMVLLCAAYVFGCAFRSAFPRADVQRICLFDSWLSSVLVGRSVATVAEICFVIQWAIVLRQLAKLVKSDTVHNISMLVVPLILMAEICSWYAVVTTNYLGNAFENSIWAATFLLIAVALARLFVEFQGIVRAAIGTALAGITAYLTFLVVIDVPMYLGRWHADLANGKAYLGALAGFYDLGTRWVAIHDLAHWRDEIAWMSLYFSAAVWSSLALCCFELVKRHLPRYRRSPAGWSAPAHTLRVRVAQPMRTASTAGPAE